MSPTPPKPTTIKAYLAALPEDRRAAIEALRTVINKNLPKGYQEGMQYGMPAWFVPHDLYPHGYHCDPRQPLPFASIASQKSHIGIYLFCTYMDPELMSWFEAEWRKTGKRWDAGKSCVRVKRLEDIPLDLVGKVVKKMPVKSFVAVYESALPAAVLAKREAVAKKVTTQKTTSRKTTSQKAAARKASPRKS